MKYLLIILLAINPVNDIKKIAAINNLKEQAKKAYEQGDYAKAIKSYELLVDSMGVSEDAIKLNLANSYFNTNNFDKASSHYRELSNSDNNIVRSAALQQQGVLANREGKFKEALELFKQSIKADPRNDDARFNYEMLKKKLKEQEDQQEQNQDQQNQQDQKEKNQNQDNKDKQNRDKQDKQDQEKQDKDQQNQQKDKQDKNEQEKQDNKDEGEQSDEEQQQDQDEKEIPPSTSDKLKEMKISDEKARMILEAMKNQEIQYIQQNKRKPTQRKDPSKPDW